MSKRNKLLSAYLESMNDEELIKTTHSLYYNFGSVYRKLLLDLLFLSVFLFPYITYRLIKSNWVWFSISTAQGVLNLVLVIILALIAEYYIIRLTGFSFNTLFDYQQPLNEKFNDAKRELESRGYSVEIVKKFNQGIANKETEKLVITKNESEK